MLMGCSGDPEKNDLLKIIIDNEVSVNRSKIINTSEHFPLIFKSPNLQIFKFSPNHPELQL